MTHRTNKKYSLMKRSVILLLLLILPFNIIGILTSVLSYRNSVKSAENAINYTLDSYVTLLDNEISNTDSMLYELTNNNLVFSMCNMEKDSEYMIYRFQLSTDTKDQMRVSNVADTIFLYLENTSDYIQFPGYDAATAGTKPYYKYIENYNMDFSHWFLTEDKTMLVRVLHNTSMNLYYGAAIDLRSFIHELGSIPGYETIVYDFNKEASSLHNGKISFNSKVSDNVYLTAHVDAKEINRNIHVIQYALPLLFFIYLSLIPLLIYLMKKHVEKPLTVLNEAHRELQKGNETYQILTSADSSEFDYAYNSFNTMASSIKELHSEVITKELSNKQLQIDYLQLQIRPHFLLNSFNVLYTLIQRRQRDSAQKMVLFLSDYFRYLFRSGHDFQLFSKERKLIEDYMDITKIYYPHSFDVSYQIDPVIDLMRIPPLLLHSFMENIIAHALLPDRKIHIVFSGEYEDGLVTFYISDDGKGMDSDALESINHITDRPIDDGKNVGIKNPIRRLKYYYGDGASVECTSELGVGTTFIIMIPYNLEDE